MVKKLTIFDIKEGFKARNWELISKNYEGSQKKLKVVCNQGHEIEITWNNFQRGQGCGICAKNKKFEFNAVKSYFEFNGCRLLEKEYTNSQVLLKYICNCGNESKINFAEFRRGRRCLKCKGNKISKSLLKEIPEKTMKELCKLNHCEFIEAFRKKIKSSNKIFIRFYCKCGAECIAYWDNFKKIQNCKKCGDRKKSGENCYMWNVNRKEVELNKLFQKRSYNLVRRSLKKMCLEKEQKKSDILGYSIEDLKNRIMNHPLYNESIDFEIDHIFPLSLFVKKGIKDMKIINNLNNLRPLHNKINLKKSNKFIDFAFDEWLKDTKVDCEKLVNSSIQNDFINQNLNNIILIDIEKAKEKWFYYKEKMDCLNNGADKLFILPSEWAYKKNQIINRSMSFCNFKFEKLGARDCEIKIIDKSQANQFLEKYHIQGASRLSKVMIGLVHNNILMGILSLGRHHRNQKELVLDRMCFKERIHISGGSEKLIKHAKIWAKDKSYKEIITFSDNRISNGDVYKRLGFINYGNQDPDYSYVLKTDNSIFISKQSQKKSATGCPKDLTENQWALQRGLVKIWDCGKKRWLLEL